MWRNSAWQRWGRWYDAFWGINSRRDFRKAVRAMITYAISEG
jgi:hypothetical protein